MYKCQVLLGRCGCAGMLEHGEELKVFLGSVFASHPNVAIRV